MKSTYRYANDKDLLQGLKNDNHFAWKQLLSEYTYSENRIKKIIRNSEDAEEVFNDTLYTFFKKISAENFVLTCKLDTYLSGIARNKIGDYIRKAKKLSLFIDIDELAYNEFAKEEFIDNSLNTDNEEEKDVINSIIDNDLKEKCRDIIKAYYYDDKSDEEAFALLGYNKAGTLKVSRHNCMEKFIAMAQEKLKKLNLF